MWRSNQSKQFKQFGSSLIWSSILMLVFQLSIHAGQNVTLSWYASSDPNVVGYKIHYGLDSHHYDQVLDVGNATNATVTLAETGVTYYFAATAYDASGVESDFSNETSFVVPAAAMLTSAGLADGQFTFTVTGTTNATYVIEASTNLMNWYPVQTNTAPFTFVDASATSTEKCFYRAVSP